jgi:hypothetical protein
MVRNAANNGVAWQMNGVQGGHSTIGTITAAGFYSGGGPVGRHSIQAIQRTKVWPPRGLLSITSLRLRKV